MQLPTVTLKALKTLPMCGRCHRPVDRLDEVDDSFMDRVSFAAHCHGEVERVSFTKEELLRMERDPDFTFGTAFVQPPALPPPSEQP